MPAGAWLYFVGAVLLVIALAVRFLGGKNQPGGRKGWILFGAIGLLSLVWGACGGFYAIYRFTDRIRAHHALDPNAVAAIEVLPGPDPRLGPPLTTERLLVTDRRQIEEIVHALKTAAPWDASHPRKVWRCILRLDDGARRDSYIVEQTTNNGLLVVVESGGLRLGEYRQDRLKEILEGLARDKRDLQDK
jgi:hypothetical protein